MFKVPNPSDKSEEIVSSTRTERITVRIAAWELELLKAEDQKRGNDNFNQTIRELIAEADQKLTIPDNYILIPEVAYEKLSEMSDRDEILSVPTLVTSLLEEYYTGVKKERLTEKLKSHNSLSSLVLSDEFMGKYNIGAEDIEDAVMNFEGNRTCYMIGSTTRKLFGNRQVCISDNVLKAAEAVSGPISRLYDREGLNPSELIIKRANDEHVKVLIGIEIYNVTRGFGPGSTTETMVGLNYYIPVTQDCYFKVSYARNDPEKLRLLFIYSGNAAKMLNERSHRLERDGISMNDIVGIDKVLEGMHNTFFKYDSHLDSKELPSGIIPNNYVAADA